MILDLVLVLVLAMRLVLTLALVFAFAFALTLAFSLVFGIDICIGIASPASTTCFWFRSALHGSAFDFIWFCLILPNFVSSSPDSSVLSESAPFSITSYETPSNIESALWDAPKLRVCFSVSSKATASEIPAGDVASTEVNVQVSVGSPESGRSSSTPSVMGSPSGIYQPGWGVTNGYRLDAPEAYQDIVDHIVPSGYFFELRHMSNAEFLGQYNTNLARQVAMGSQLRLREEEIKKLDQEIKSLKAVESEVHGLQNQTNNLKTLLEGEVDMKKAAKAKNVELSKELDSLRFQFSDLQVSNSQLSQQISILQAQVTGEERIKAAFEEFKKYEDDRVEQRCAEIDAHLDKLSIDFDEELYPHMLTAIAGHHWVIGHSLRLAVIKCAESS
ncbi:hypothetical protein Tco_1012852 [Tanacetum coccineum]